MPLEFIQDTEDTGLIVPIGERVLEEACRRATEWGNQYGHSTTMMCVNLSMKQLQDPDLGDKIKRVLRRAALVAPNPLWGCIDNDRAVAAGVDLPLLRSGNPHVLACNIYKGWQNNPARNILVLGP